MRPSRLGARERAEPPGVGERLKSLARAGDLDRLPLADIGEMLREQLVEQSLPSWCRNTLDRRHGGFLLEAGRRVPGRNGMGRGKQLVSQSRMLWVLSHAHVHQMRLEGHDLVARATDGYRFIQTHFHDGTHGGYVWKTTRSGVVQDDRKVLYGQAFAIYALVEYSRASGDRRPLQEALALWRVIMGHLHDPEHQGWIEHARSDWSPLGAGLGAVPVGPSGTKSANTHLHWMEALTELVAATGDPEVRATLESVTDLLTEHCFPEEPDAAHGRFTHGWDRVDDVDGAGFSLGHTVEFAWLLLRAEGVLGRTVSADRLAAYLDHGLDAGFDVVRGGFSTRAPAGEADRPRRRNWWVQAELLVALAVALAETPGGQRYERALRRQLAFVVGHQIDPRDGVWWEEVDEDGRVTKANKQHDWKAAYHEVRALRIVSDLLRGRGGSAVSP